MNLLRCGGADSPAIDAPDAESILRFDPAISLLEDPALPRRLFPQMTYARKLFVLATLPLVLAVAAIALLVAHQSRAMAEREIADLEAQLISAK